MSTKQKPKDAALEFIFNIFTPAKDPKYTEDEIERLKAMTAKEKRVFIKNRMGQK